MENFNQVRYNMKFSDGSVWAIPLTMIILEVATRNDENPQYLHNDMESAFEHMSQRKFDALIVKMVKDAGIQWADIAESCTEITRPLIIK